MTEARLVTLLEAVRRHLDDPDAFTHVELQAAFRADPAAAPAETVEQRVRRLDRGPIPPTIAVAPAEGLLEALAIIEDMELLIQRLRAAAYDDPDMQTREWERRLDAEWKAIDERRAASPATSRQGVSDA